MNKTETILNLVKDEDVRFIRLQFTDLSGKIRNMAITVGQLEKALAGELTFNSLSVEGFDSGEEQELYLKPDISTFEIFPWRPHQGKVARFICDIYNQDNRIYEADPRNILKKIIAEAGKMGINPLIQPKCEFFLFNTDESGNATTNTNDLGTYFDVAPLDNGENCRREIIMTLEDMGFEIESSHHEMGNGQHQVNFKKGELLLSADRLMTFKMTVKTIAKRHGMHATFMAKPVTEQPGSGMYFDISLNKDGKNIISKDNVLTDTARKFIAGILKYTPQMAFITNPTVNSYRRLVTGSNAPCYIGWSDKNKDAIVRVFKLQGDNASISFRAPDPTANPYLAIAAVIKAGIEGIKYNFEPWDYVPVGNENLKNLETMPANLIAAVEESKKSSFAKELMGEKMYKSYIKLKTDEYNDYKKYVGQWELEKYLNKY